MFLLSGVNVSEVSSISLQQNEPGSDSFLFVFLNAMWGLL